MNDPKQYPVLGVPVTDATIDEAVALLYGMIDASPTRSHSVYFVNAHTLNVSCDDSSYRAVLTRADRVFGDGTGVRWAARALYNHRLRDNVNGTDLVPRLLSSHPERGCRYYLLGNKPDRIVRAAQYAQRTFSAWTLAGYHHGYVTEADHQRVIDDINRSHAQLLLVGMGNPLQERWIDTHLNRINVPVCMGIGGLFDYWSGDLERAPKWVRRVGYEWLHLLVRQPSKARRYLLGNPLFLARVAQQKARGAVSP